jgi:hypothetical protein
VVPVLTVFAGHGITKLLQALGANAKFLRDCLLCRVIGEEDEGLESRVRVLFLVDAPKNVAEEGLEVHGYGTLGRLLNVQELAAVAGGAIGRLDGGRSSLLFVPGFTCHLDTLAEKRLGGLWRLGRIPDAVGRAHGGLVGQIEGREGALEVLVVVVVVGLAVFHGQQRLGEHELVHLGPGRVCFVDALELDAVGDFARDRGDVVEPFDGFARVGVDALSAGLQPVQLGEGW